ncbi:MAG: hypothetical protein R6U58_01465 [Bacteroidales bacterium]
MPVLFKYCRSLFAGCHLPSHDHHHHLRVWHYAKDILLELSEKGIQLSSNQVSLLMLSVFFHDTGLTKTLDKMHGLESMRICRDFLDRNPELFTVDVYDALRAIELHDKKESPAFMNRYTEPDILEILAISDDADAYGPVGVLRYAEIYLLRGISYSSLPGMVLKNMFHRFEFLSSRSWVPEMFFEKHKSRYNYAKNFYLEMEMQQQSGSIYHTNRKILETYMNKIVKDKMDIQKFAGELIKSDNQRIRDFGISLSCENDSCNYCYSS